MGIGVIVMGRVPVSQISRLAFACFFRVLEVMNKAWRSQRRKVMGREKSTMQIDKTACGNGFEDGESAMLFAGADQAPAMIDPPVESGEVLTLANGAKVMGPGIYMPFELLCA
jgi:hypothetical protein